MLTGVCSPSIWSKLAKKHGGYYNILAKWGPTLQVDQATTKSSLLILGYHPRFMYWNSYNGTAITWWQMVADIWYGRHRQNSSIKATATSMALSASDFWCYTDPNGFPIQKQPVLAQSVKNLLHLRPHPCRHLLVDAAVLQLTTLPDHSNDDCVAM